MKSEKNKKLQLFNNREYAILFQYLNPNPVLILILNL